jgi:DNA-3-methyladenine glycosylase I
MNKNKENKQPPEPTRCAWAIGSDRYLAYHDDEWGVPVHDDNTLFEFIILEGAQAGLSWSTILNKREGYRELFAHFEPAVVADFAPEHIATLLLNPAIVRNRAKVNATVGNARAVLQIQQEFGSFDRYLWQFVDGRPIQNHWQDITDVPTSTAHSDALSKALKERGFKFVGTTICYAFMQAVGMVNDHTTSCFRHAACRHAVGS